MTRPFINVTNVILDIQKKILVTECSSPVININYYNKKEQQQNGQCFFSIIDYSLHKINYYKLLISSHHIIEQKKLKFSFLIIIIFNT